MVANPNENTYLVRLNSECDQGALIQCLTIDKPDWNIQVRTDNPGGIDSLGNIVLSSSQRQSGLFQLRIPDSGVLPVAPNTLAKINSYSPALQYSLTPLEQPILPITPPIMNRLYEDWHEFGSTETFKDPLEAREAALKLAPPLGEWEGDVFFGRLDNQKVTIDNILELSRAYGEVSFVRLCNRSIIREDRGKLIHEDKTF